MTDNFGEKVSFIWSVADLLRGLYKPTQYGTVILPLTVHSTLSNDAFPSREVDFMLSNPPYGKSWKSDLDIMGGEKKMREHRFMIEHAGDPEYSLITHSSDGQMLFLANMQSGCPAASRTSSN